MSSPPCAKCHSCRGERRTGRKCCPIWRPANAPIDTGVKGGRKVVVPTSGIATPLKPASMDRALMLLVFP